MAGHSFKDLWRRPGQGTTRPEPEAQALPPASPAQARLLPVIQDGAQAPRGLALVPAPLLPEQGTNPGIKIELAEGYKKLGPAPGADATGADLDRLFGRKATRPRVHGIGDPETLLALQHALTLDVRNILTGPQELRVKGALEAAFTGLKENCRNRDSWRTSAREELETLRRQVEMFARTQENNRAVANRVGKDVKADAQRRDLEAMREIEGQYAFAIKLKGPLPKGLHEGLTDGSHQELVDQWRERMLCVLEGSRFDLDGSTEGAFTPENGMPYFLTTMDQQNGLKATAHAKAMEPGVRPNLVLDPKSLAIIQKLRKDLDDRGFDAATEYSRIGVPTLAESLNGKGLDKALSEAIASSAAKSGASPLEAKVTRDAALALSGDPLMVTLQARRMAEIFLKDNPKVQEYKDAAKELSQWTDSKDLANKLGDFANSAVELVSLDQNLLHALSRLGEGPGAVLGNALAGPATSLEYSDADKLSGAFQPSPGFAAPHEPQANLVMDSSIKPGYATKLYQVSRDGHEIRIAGYDTTGKPQVIFEGGVMDAIASKATDQRMKDYLDRFSSALTTSHARAEAALSLGFVLPKPQFVYPETPYLMDPTKDAPAMEVVRYGGTPMTLEEIEAWEAKEMAMVGRVEHKGIEFGGLL